MLRARRWKTLAGEGVFLYGPQQKCGLDGWVSGGWAGDSVMRPLLLGELCKQHGLDKPSCALYQIQQLKNASLSHRSLSGSAVCASFRTELWVPKLKGCWLKFIIIHITTLGRRPSPSGSCCSNTARVFFFYHDGLEPIVVATAEWFLTHGFSLKKKKKKSKNTSLTLFKYRTCPVVLKCCGRTILQSSKPSVCNVLVG